jgi:hypothetical protein
MTERTSESEEREVGMAGSGVEGGAAETAPDAAVSAFVSGIATESASQAAGGADVVGEAAAVSPVEEASPQPGSAEHYEKRVRDLQSQNDRLRHQISRQEQLQEEQSGTLVALKDALLRANPLIPAELLDASSPASLSASFQSAEQVVGSVRQRLQEEQRSAGQPWRIPAGAPVRAGVDVESLSPGEKIRHGLAQKMGR